MSGRLNRRPSDQIERGRERLYARVGRLAALFGRGLGRAELIRKLRGLTEAAASQFAAEEREMSAGGFAGLAEHRLAHQELLHHLDASLAEFRIDGRDFLIAELGAFLRDWLVLHGARADTAWRCAKAANPTVPSLSRCA